MDREDLSRRHFISAVLAGAVGSLALSRQGQSSDVTKLSISEAAELIRKKKVSPVELTKACLARIEQLNLKLNVFITITAESALAQAREAESDVQRGRWRGPLHGIPIALKDLFDTAGVRTTAASAVFKDRVPNADAEVVRRLKAAGAVILGKTNMHEFAFGGTSAVSYFGAVHNPWEAGHIAGGSSGGSAAGLAAGLFYGALGSDTGGSIRQPAAYCGIVGLKPTYGLVSNRGVIPLSWSLDHVGPMTRKVVDAAIMLQAIAGYDRAETTSQEMKIPDYSGMHGMKVSSLRLGVAREFFFADLDPEIEVAMSKAVAELEKLTGSLRDIALSAGIQERLRAAVRAAEAYAYHAEFVTKTPELYQPETLQRIRTGADMSTPAYIQARRDLAETRRTIANVFERVDAIVTPTTAVQPPTLTELGASVSTSIEIGNRTIRNTSPFNVYGLPTISIPCGFTRTGLPLGLQISGPPGGDGLVLQLAHAYEQAMDWHERIPR